MLDGLEDSVERKGENNVGNSKVAQSPKDQTTTTDVGAFTRNADVSVKSSGEINELELEPLRKQSSSAFIEEMDEKAYKLGLINKNSIDVNGVPVFTTLTKSQVIQGKRRIKQELTPLQDIPIENLLPSLRCCKGYFQRSRKKRIQNQLDLMGTSNKVHDSSVISGQDEIQKQRVEEETLMNEQKNEFTESLQSGGILRDLPAHDRYQINQESQKLHESLKVDMKATYKGTDPLVDAQKIHKQQNEILHGKDDALDNTATFNVQDNPDYPFQNYGLGITSYFRLIKVLTWVFVIISIIGGIPVAIVYSNQDGYDQNDKGLLIKQMVGNLGESYHTCQSKYRGFGHDPQLKCKVGIITELAYAGIVPYKAPQDRQKNRLGGGKQQNRGNTYHVDFCGDPELYNPIKQCTKLFKSEKFRQQFDSKCTGKTECSMNLDEDMESYIKEVDTTDAAQLQALGMTKEEVIECSHTRASIYRQYHCGYEGIHLKQHQRIGLYLTVTSILICLVFRYAVYYLRAGVELDQTLVDVQTMTTADFAIKIFIEEKHWKAWLDYRKGSGFMSFREFLKQEIEKQVTALPISLKKNKAKAIKVANINFGFDNQNIIKMLESRGSAIMAGNGDKSKKIEKEIEVYAKENFEKIQRPCTAFVIFERQEGQQRCFDNFETTQNSLGFVNWNKSGKAFMLFGEKVMLEEANEPSDINWKNQRYSRRRIFCSTVIAVITLIIFLWFLIWGSAILGNKSADASRKYPESTDCNILAGKFSKDSIFLQKAELDKPHALNFKGRGFYMCWCMDKTNEDDHFYEGEERVEPSFCEDYWKDKLAQLISQKSIALVIVVMNIIIQVLCQVLTRRIGLHSYNQTILRSSLLIFFGQYVNFSLIQMISNANLDNTPLENAIPESILRNNYHDMSPAFYAHVGSTIHQTMFIKSLLPWIKALIFFSVSWCKKRKDSGSTANHFIPSTKCPTVQQFINMHSGPELKLDLQYSYIFLMVFTTFTYGIALPLLFPICAFGMFNLYVSEKLQFAYLYRKPPSYGGELNLGALDLLAKCPFFLLFFGYWILGNRQEFFNAASEKVHASDNTDPGHKLFMYKEGPDYTMIFLIFIPIFVFFEYIIIAIRFISYKIGCWHQMKGADLHWRLQFAVDEKLGNYWRSIKGAMQLRLYFKEKYQRKTLNIKMMPDDKLNMLESAQRGQKFITNNAVNYDILGDPSSQSVFYFVTLDRRHNESQSFLYDFIPSVLYQGEDCDGVKSMNKGASANLFYEETQNNSPQKQAKDSEQK